MFPGPINYIDFITIRMGPKIDPFPLIPSSQVPSLLKDIAFPSSLSALQNALRPVSPHSRSTIRKTSYSGIILGAEIKWPLLYKPNIVAYDIKPLLYSVPMDTLFSVPLPYTSNRHIHLCDRDHRADT